MFTFLVSVLVKSTVVLVAALGVTLVMRKRSAAGRHFVWVLAFAGLLLLPALENALPAWRVMVPWGRATGEPVGNSGESVLSAIPELEQEILTAGSTPRGRSGVDVVGSPREKNPAGARLSVLSAVLFIYAGGVLVCLLRLVGAAVALLRVERRAKRLREGPWVSGAGAIAAELSLRRTVTLLESPDEGAMPMTWGIGRAWILVPAGECSAERRRLVLLHELGHVKRFDVFTQLFAGVVTAIYWCHPLVWLARRQLRVEAEGACDDLVITAKTSPSLYAEELLTLASTCRVTIPFSAIAMARTNGSPLYSRVRGILDQGRSRKGLAGWAVLLMVLATMAALVPLATVRAAEEPEAFPNVVKFDLGKSQFLQGDNLTITEIRGTAATITPGNTYQIKGTYTLASADDAQLATYVTAASVNDTHHDPYDNRQTVVVKKGTGTFTVVLPFLSKGSPHLSFYPTAGGSSFSALYFGSGESLYKSNEPVYLLISPDWIVYHR